MKLGRSGPLLLILACWLGAASPSAGAPARRSTRHGAKARQARQRKPPPRPTLDLGYYTEAGLHDHPPVIVASGRIHIQSADFELDVPRGGVVLWVDPKRWKEFRKQAQQGAGGQAGKAHPAATTSPMKKAEDVLGPVIHQIYAEGGVVLRRDDEVVRAERLFFDFSRNRAVILKGQVLTYIGRKGTGLRIPLSVRASRLYEVAKNELQAHSATLTTCLFGKPHYELSVGEVDISRVPGGESFSAWDDVLSVEGIPVLWLPWFYGDSYGTEPFQGLQLGRSSKFGYFAGIELGGHIGGGKGGSSPASWSVTPWYRDRRGPGLGLGIDIRTDSGRGRLQGEYQRDRANTDRVTSLPIPSSDRGRLRLQHYQVLSHDLLGARLTGIAEASWISDRGYLPEYHTGEYLQGKAQEDVLHLALEGKSEALSVTGNWRGNDFETETEYRPRIAYDLFSTPVLSGLAGTASNLYLSGEADAADVYRAFDTKLPDEGVDTKRVLGRAELALPVEIGPVKISPRFGGSLTGYSGDQSSTRLGGYASIRAATDLWRVYPDVRSSLLDLDGLRHVIDLSAGFADRFAVSEGSRKIFVQDPADLLDRIQAFDVRVRNRLETKRSGQVVTWLDWETRALFFPEAMPARPSPLGFREEFQQGLPSLLVPGEEKFRSMARKGMGPVLSRLRMELRPDLFLAGDIWYDFESRRFETYSVGFRYRALPKVTFGLGHRVIHGDGSLLTATLDVKLTPRWGLRAVEQANLSGGAYLTTGVVLRRRFHDFVLEFDVRRNVEERVTSFGLTIVPSELFDRQRAEHRKVGALDFPTERWYR